MTLNNNYRWLKTIISSSILTLVVIALSYHLDWIGQHVLTYQFEKFGFAVEDVEQTNVGWRRACFKGIKLRPLPMQFLPSCQGTITIAEMNIRYLPKDLLLHRFREVRIDGIAGMLIVGAPPLTLTLEEAPVIPKIDPTELALANKTLNSYKVPNTLTIQNLKLDIRTPQGQLWAVGGIHINDFFSKNMLGQGKLLLRSPTTLLNITLKTDKIEPRIWRLSGDASNGRFDTPWTTASDVNSHIECIIGHHATDINGHTQISQISFPTLGLTNVQNLEGDFKAQLTNAGEVDSNVLLKLPEFKYQDCRGKNLVVNTQVKGTIQAPVTSAKVDITGEDINCLPYVKNWAAKLRSEWKNDKLSVEGSCTHLPAVLNIKAQYDHAQQTLSGLVATASPIIWEPKTLQPIDLTDLIGGLHDVTGKTTIKGEFNWPINQPFTPHITLSLSGVDFKAGRATKIENILGDMKLDGLWTDQDPAQTLHMDRLIHDGTDLTELQLDYHLSPGGIMDVLVLAGLYGKRSLKLKDFTLHLPTLGKDLDQKLS